jgi:hypothetical protein
MERIRIKAARFEFIARFEPELAPQTCAKFWTMLPYKQRVIHVRWSGEACWIPLGELDLGLKFENATSYPAPGEIILYPGGVMRPKSCSLTVTSASPAKPASSPEIIF